MSTKCFHILFSGETYFRSSNNICVCVQMRPFAFACSGLQLRHNNVFITQLINGESSCKHMPIDSVVKNWRFLQKWIELRRNVLMQHPVANPLMEKGSQLTSLWNIEVGACKQNQALLLPHSGKHTTARSLVDSGQHHVLMKQSGIGSDTQSLAPGTVKF